MLITTALPPKATLSSSATVNANNRQQPGNNGSAALQNGSAGQPAFARTLDRARTDPVVPSPTGGPSGPFSRFGNGGGGGYGAVKNTNSADNASKAGSAADSAAPAAGPSPDTQKTRQAAPADDAAKKEDPALQTGGPDVPTEPDPSADPAAGDPKTDPTDKHAANTRASTVRLPGAGADPRNVRQPGLPPVQPLPPVPVVDPVEGGVGDPVRVPFGEQPVPVGPPVECPVDGGSVLAAVLAPPRKMDDANLRAKMAAASSAEPGAEPGALAGSGNAADTVDSKGAFGGVAVPRGKQFGTEPVRSLDGSGTGAEATGNASSTASAFGTRLQAALGAAADAASAGTAAISAALSATPSAPSASPGATDGAALLQGKLPASPGSADFAPQLAAQISTFIRDGVHHAQLELNPAEMGPLLVQIKLDGSAANVNMSAQHADTRHALEQALPQLASTLREAGLTLSGGGVFEQPQQPQSGQSGDGDRQSAKARGSDADQARGTGDASGDGRRTQAAAPPLRQRGMVDLIA